MVDQREKFLFGTFAEEKGIRYLFRLTFFVLADLEEADHGIKSNQIKSRITFAFDQYFQANFNQKLTKNI